MHQVGGVETEPTPEYSEYLTAEDQGRVKDDQNLGLKLKQTNDFRQQETAVFTPRLVLSPFLTLYKIDASVFLDKQPRFADPTLSRKCLSSPEKVESVNEI